MGKEISEETVTDMEDVLGLREETVAKEIPDAQKMFNTPIPDNTKKEDPKKEEAPAQEAKKEETSQTKTTVVTDEQISINKGIAKIDLQIEALESETVDTNSFYDNLEEELSQEEQELEFSDKPAYMKMVNAKAKEYETKHSKTDEIQALKDEKKEQELIYDRQSAIVEVSTKYPDYNHENVLKYFTEDLSKTQQEEIFEASSSYADVYTKAYEKLMGTAGANIKEQKAPNIPDVSTTRREAPKSDETDDGLQTEDQQLQDALGL